MEAAVGTDATGRLQISDRVWILDGRRSASKQGDITLPSVF